MPSINEVSTDLLRWLEQQGATETDPVDPTKFLAQAGGQITDAELTRACRRLTHAGLIDGISIDQLPRLAQAGLTAAGEQCIDDFGGDITKFEERHVSKDQSVWVTAGGDAQVAAHSHNITQVHAGGDVDVNKLTETAKMASEVLPALNLPAQKKEQVEEAIKGILEETQKAEPDQQKLKGWGSRLKDGITAVAGTGTIVKLLLDGLGAAGVM